MQQRTINSRNKPISIANLPNFNPDHYKDVMAQNTKKKCTRQEKLKLKREAEAERNSKVQADEHMCEGEQSSKKMTHLA